MWQLVSHFITLRNFFDKSSKLSEKKTKSCAILIPLFEDKFKKFIHYVEITLKYILKQFFFDCYGNKATDDICQYLCICLTTEAFAT